MTQLVFGLEVAMKILLAIDDSGCSREALEFVSRMSWPDDAELLVLSVPPTRFLLGAEYFGHQLYVEEAEKQAMEFHLKIANDAEARLKSLGIPVRSLAVMGDPRVVILDTVHEAGIDLVVVGSHGRTGLAQLAMGSVASHVATHAPCSVLIVKKPGQRSS